MKTYIKINGFPVMMEAIFILSCFFVAKDYYIYTNFCFYMILTVYFWLRNEFSFQQWIHHVKSGKKFWKSVIVTLLGLAGAVMVTTVLEMMFPGMHTGMILLKGRSWIKLILFGISTILLPAAAEELFYRKNIISFQNKAVLVFTALSGMLMFAAVHALAVWGIFLTMIWALPLSIAYIKTRNIYIPMTAHFIGDLFVNGITVILGIHAMISNR